MPTHRKRQLIEPKVDKTSDPNIIRLIALERVDSYPSTAIHAYTDGSAFKGTTFAGYGVNLQCPNGTSLDFSDACGCTCSNNEAELKALRTAIELTHQFFELDEHTSQDIVIFTDSKSALQAIENFDSNLNDEITYLLKATHNLLSSYDIQITMQ